MLQTHILIAMVLILAAVVIPVIYFKKRPSRFPCLFSSWEGLDFICLVRFSKISYIDWFYSLRLMERLR